ncbi:sodium-coupled monocarboxylate transporter 1-like [Tiliqua scincoides]|uniref:sodium-coupled monocarboxylate transporter 1-like n=1 Tax=Tiliqua scincoides TaxID=71010 RepID=UPI003462F0FC
MSTADKLAFVRIQDHFTQLDYLLFALMLLVSAAIGVYYAFKDVHKSHEEFIMASRKLHCAPVALSLTASFMSAVTVLGTPAEVYRFGMKYGLIAISYAVMVAITAHVFLPVYYRLRITSAYEYLELRYNNKYLRMTGAAMFMMQTIFYSGIVIYTPAFALNQVTGFVLWGAVAATGVICIFYCILGGLRAVVWTDVFQFLMMICAMILVIARTVSIKGGLSCILDDARHGGRLDFWDFNPSPFQRHTFWTIVIGGSFTWLGVYVINQSQVQRCLSCRSLGHAKLALYINLLGLWLTLCCATLSGLAMYSMFKDCDPWTAKKVTAPDQLIPYLVLKLGEDIPGILGFFVAGTYSGTLSTVSSSINALATVTVEDLVKRNLKTVSEEDLSSISMGMSLLFGIICIAMAAVTSVLTGVLQITLTVFGVIGGPLLGIYALGVLLPSANAKGAFSGLICGIIIILWIGIGSQMYPIPPQRAMPLHLSTAGCHAFNWTVPTTIAKPPTAPRPPIYENLYSISYLYLSPFGTLVTLMVGTVVSLSTGGLRQDIDRSLLFGKEDLIADYEYLKAKASQSWLQKQRLLQPRLALKARRRDRYTLAARHLKKRNILPPLRNATASNLTICT